MSKLIVIVGVTGTQGSSVARAFLRFPKWRVRGISRDPSSDAARALSTEGVEIIKADLDDKESLRPAFVGATAIFANTDFFGHLASEPAPGRSILEHAFDREVAQGINIAEAAASPEVLTTLEHYIYSSLCDAKKLSGGKYQTLHHFNSKADTIQATQSRFPELRELTSSLQMGHYVTTWKALPFMAPQKQTDGSFTFIRPASPAAKWPLVVPLRDTGSFVKILVDSPPGKHLLGASQIVTWPEFAALWGKVLGVEAAFKQVTTEEFFKDVPEPIKTELKEGFDFIEEYGYTGGDPDVITTEQLGVEVSLTSMEDYIKSEDWSSVLEQ